MPHGIRNTPEVIYGLVSGNPDDACWDWPMQRSTAGYGRVRLDGKTLQAHRVTYEYAVGPIPSGLLLHHECRNKACVNPAHLRPVTHRDNLLLDDTLPARMAAKTHCVNGHEFTEANTWYSKHGYRACRMCNRNKARVRRGLLPLDSV